MEWMIIVIVAVVLYYLWRTQSAKKTSLSHLPPTFIVFDLETTGLNASTHEILEIGAIKVYRDATEHETFQTLVKPSKKVPKKITEITGITQAMVDAEGKPIEEAFREFRAFIGELHLVTFNAEFDMAFIHAAALKQGTPVRNSVACALKMARRAWPGMKSYRLGELAKQGNLNIEGVHRALADAQLAMIVYGAAARKLGTIK